MSLTILAGSGNDTITVNSDVTLGVTINGGDGSDTIRGGGGNDGIMGKGKADLILGGTGVDTVDGGAGDDVFASRDDLLDNICGLREHYVSNSTGGDDANTGIYGAPWRKIEHALQMAVPGDTIRIYGTGIVYELGLETHVQIDKPNLTLEGYDSAAQGFVRPQIRLDYTLGHVDEAGHGNSTVEVGPAADNTRLRYLDISGGYFALKTFNTGFQDIYIENPEDLEAPDYRVGEGATGLLIEECWLHGSAEDVVKLTPGCDSAVIRSSRIFDSGLWWRDGHASSGVGENAEGIDAVNVDGAIVEHNEIYQTLTNGVYFKGGSRDTLINANFVHHAGYLATEGYSGIVVGQDTDLWFFDREVGNDELYESVDAVVRNNIVADCGGAGVLVWAALNARILNNTLVRVAGTNRAGIQVVSQDHEVIEFVDEDMITRVVNRPSTNATIQNNIIDLTDRSGRPVISIAYPTGLDSGMPTFSNNLYYVDEVTGVYFEDQRPYSDSPYHPYATYAYDTSEDRWEGSGATDSSLWFGDADSIVAAPAFASADPQVAADYRLATGSPCIGAGEYLIATVPDDYLGEARSDPFDIGAYRA